MNLLAIDPGNEKSGWAILEKKTYRPVGHGINNNHTILDAMTSGRWKFDEVVIEGYEFQGRQFVGQTVFDTCIWIGRFEHHAKIVNKVPVTLIKRGIITNHLLGRRGKDADVVHYLVNRFARGVGGAMGKGTKSDPEWFYGFSEHVWQAYACGVAHLDLCKRQAMFDVAMVNPR